ncbi:guanylate kinase [Salibacteraceae bacterium]|nr:guanylate kinase [Salibacteraceae bacterium]
MNPKGKAVIFSAPSGAGKTTIVRALLASDLPLQFSVSATSRAPRGEENHGKDYYFLGINGFKDSVDKDGFLEWEEVYPDQFYGTLKSEIDRIWESGNAVIFDVDVYGGIALKEKFGDKALSVFVMPPSVEALEARLRFRQTESEEKIQMRLSKANEELAMGSEFDFELINAEVDIAVNNAKERIGAFLSDE